MKAYKILAIVASALVLCLAMIACDTSDGGEPSAPDATLALHYKLNANVSEAFIKADVAKLLEVLQRLCDAGNTVLVIEHNLDVIKCADHIIDLGPEGGDAGGTLVARGTPEEVAKNPDSYTGQYLEKWLKR